jgi:hypothetical protein
MGNGLPGRLTGVNADGVTVRFVFCLNPRLHRSYERPHGYLLGCTQREKVGLVSAGDYQTMTFAYREGVEERDRKIVLGD